MPEQILQFRFDGDESAWTGLMSKFKQLYIIDEQPDLNETRTFLDTFDWRFFRKNLTFSHTGNTYELRDMDNNNFRGAFRWKRKAAMRFAWDIPERDLRQAFAAIQEERAVMPVVTIEASRKIYSFMNNDHKTVLRMEKVLPRVVGRHQHLRQLFTYVLVFPVRGYDKYFKAASEMLESSGLLRLPPEHNLLTDALKTVDREPDDYSSKLQPRLEPGMDSRTAAVIILRELLQIMRQNEEGIKADIDSEFLHDFRVAVRKTRSALSQIRQVFPEDGIAFFKQGFGELGEMTNKMRDHDVYLLKREHYMAMLPAALRDGLKPFFAGIRRLRHKEHIRLLKRIDSGEYRHFILDWEDFLAKAEALPPTANSSCPAIELAKKSISRRFRKILQAGRAIGPASPDSEIHALRIQCKKLRYMLEFFTPLLSGDTLNSTITELKKLQTNLGDFNDLCVQIATLNGRLQSLPARKDSIATAAALGGLVSELNRERLSVRKNFENTFEQFSSDSGRAAFSGLFGSCPAAEADN